MSEMSTGNAGNTEASQTSAPRLKVSPQNLPEPPLKQPKVKRLEEMTPEEAAKIKDYYADRIHKIRKTKKRGVRKKI